MKLNKAFRPYCATVSNDGTRTNFSCQDSRLDKTTGRWENGMWYTVSVNGLNFPIEKKNPQGYKLLAKKIEGITFSEFNGKPQVTIWLDDVEIQDKDGKTIIDSVKKAANYMGKKASEVSKTTAEDIANNTPEGFEQIDPDTIPF